jgi:hypothetical protein
MIELPLQLALTFMVAVLLNRFSSEIERISPKLGRAVVDFLHRSYARLSTTSRIAISARPVGASSEPDRGAAA